MALSLRASFRLVVRVLGDWVDWLLIVLYFSLSAVECFLDSLVVFLELLPSSLSRCPAPTPTPSGTSVNPTLVLTSQQFFIIVSKLCTVSSSKIVGLGEIWMR